MLHFARAIQRIQSEYRRRDDWDIFIKFCLSRLFALALIEKKKEGEKK